MHEPFQGLNMCAIISFVLDWWSSVHAMLLRSTKYINKIVYIFSHCLFAVIRTLDSWIILMFRRQWCLNISCATTCSNTAIQAEAGAKINLNSLLYRLHFTKNTFMGGRRTGRGCMWSDNPMFRLVYHPNQQKDACVGGQQLGRADHLERQISG